MAGLKGKAEPRIFTPPLGELTPETSLGFEVVDFAEGFLGLTLRPWQKWLFVHALELDPASGYEDFRFRTVIVEVGRQNGKTLVMVVLGLWRMFMFGASEILSAAQSLKVAEDTLEDAFDLAKQSPELLKYLPIRKERGKWVPYMRQTNGSNELFLESMPPGLEHALDVTGAPTSWYVVPTNSGGGRSYSADLAMLDELREHQSMDVWESIVPATRERPKNQVWGFSNAGSARSVVLKKFRNLGIAAIDSGATDDERLAYFSWSAEPSCSIFDPEGWAQANPSLGYGNRDERDMLAEAKQALDPSDPDSSESGFRTEYLCQWVESLDVGKVTEALWKSVEDPDSVAGEVDGVGIDVALDGERAHVVIASKRPDGKTHIEVVASGAGYTWVPHFLNERRGTWFQGSVAMQVKGAPSNALVPLLTNAGIVIDEWQGSDMTSSVLGFYDAIRDGLIAHPGRDPRRPDEPDLLESAALGVRERRSGDTFIWSREGSLCDATPFIAANIAWWQAHREKEEFVSAYSADDWDDDVSDVDFDDDDDDYLLIV